MGGAGPGDTGGIVAKAGGRDIKAGDCCLSCWLTGTGVNFGFVPTTGKGMWQWDGRGPTCCCPAGSQRIW
jgi:hypothetical protein